MSNFFTSPLAPVPPEGPDPKEKGKEMFAKFAKEWVLPAFEEATTRLNEAGYMTRLDAETLTLWSIQPGAMEDVTHIHERPDLNHYLKVEYDPETYRVSAFEKHPTGWMGLDAKKAYDIGLIEAAARPKLFRTEICWPFTDRSLGR